MARWARVALPAGLIVAAGVWWGADAMLGQSARITTAHASAPTTSGPPTAAKPLRQ